MAIARTDVRPMVRKAIMTRFNANPSHPFVTGVGGRFAYNKAGTGWAFPYSIFFFTDDHNNDTFTERIDTVFVQISVWGSSEAIVEDLSSFAYDLFEGKNMAATGLAPFRFLRDTPVPTLDESTTTLEIQHSGICLKARVQTI